MCLVAFYDLSTCRQRSVSGDGAHLIGPIPWTAIAQWAAVHRIAGPDLDVFTAAIRAMDATWLPLEADRIKGAQRA